MDKRSEFAALLARVQTGDADAARQLYDDYGPHIVRAVRRRLHARLRSQFDSMDFVQDVWASFFAENAENFALTSPAQLVQLLTTMARNKVIQTERERTQRRTGAVHREHSLEETHGGSGELAAPMQTPSQIVMGEEAWDQLLAQQPPVYRRILLLLRQGYSNERIAAVLKITLRTVQRVIHKISP